MHRGKSHLGAKTHLGVNARWGANTRMEAKDKITGKCRPGPPCEMQGSLTPPVKPLHPLVAHGVCIGNSLSICVAIRTGLFCTERSFSSKRCRVQHLLTCIQKSFAFNERNPMPGSWSWTGTSLLNKWWFKTATKKCCNDREQGIAILRRMRLPSQPLPLQTSPIAEQRADPRG